MTSTAPTPVTASKDLNILLTHTSLKVAQGLSLLTPPIYLVGLALRRRPFSIARTMRVFWGVPALGAAASVPAAWYRLKDEPEEALSDRTFRLAHNVTQIRTDDYSLIGAALGALVVPTIFLRRAALLNLLLGGASLGMAGGVLAHLGKSAQEGREVKPVGMTEELPVVGSKKGGSL